MKRVLAIGENPRPGVPLRAWAFRLRHAEKRQKTIFAFFGKARKGLGFLGPRAKTNPAFRPLRVD